MAGKFTAGSSALGYLHQLRYGLYLALSSRTPGAKIFLETVDDILFEPVGEPREIIQTKHHSKPGNISDASPDLWRTLRIWIENRRTEAESRFLMVTTQTAAAGSIAALLRPGKGRNETAALARLDQTSLTSTNKENAAAIEAWKGLKNTEKYRLVQSISILDAAPSIIELDALLQDRLRLLADRDKLSDFVSDVEGRWFRRCVEKLSKPKPEPIIADEFQEYARERARWYRREVLSLEFDAEVPAGIEDQHDERQFVRQMKWVGVNAGLRRGAIHDYYRAFHQRGVWLRRLEVLPDELASYDSLLEEEWRRRFLTRMADLPDGASPEVKQLAGRHIFNWVNMEAAIHIRTDCTRPWICRGSLHQLADENPPRIGWHPNFESLCEGGD